MRGDPRVSLLDLAMSGEVSQECVDKEVSHGYCCLVLQRSAMGAKVSPRKCLCVLEV